MIFLLYEKGPSTDGVSERSFEEIKEDAIRRGVTMIPCPCAYCRGQGFLSLDVIEKHLLKRGWSKSRRKVEDNARVFF